MSAIVAIPPGTHHVKFLVDGEMRTSPSLPTAVDDTGILVNYLEVSADDMPPLHRADSSSTAGQQTANRAHEASSTERIPTLPPTETALHYTTEIPSYLRDLDHAEDDLHYADGAPPPPPPTLPMMLQKVILNGSSSMRDDASVLGIPNHAVLNHLATSSIKNSILAVSATTRYKKKVPPSPSPSPAPWPGLLICSSMSLQFCIRRPRRQRTRLGWCPQFFSLVVFLLLLLHWLGSRMALLFSSFFFWLSSHYT
jgi:hypothetical protein